MRTWFSPRAESDVADIYHYISRESQRAAAKLVRKIRKAVRTVIARFPRAGKSCDELAPGLRQYSVGNYVVYYRLTSRVEIVRVLHAARDAGTVFRRQS
jgi:toxin ParE1/3/4